MRTAARGLLVSMWLLGACGDDDDSGGQPDAGTPGTDAGLDAAPLADPDAAVIPPCAPEHEDDPPAPDEPACPAPIADGARDLLAEARDLAGDRTEIAWTETDWSAADYLDFLDNGFVAPAYAATHDHPEQAPCFADGVARRLDAIAASRHAVSRAIAEGADQIGIALAPDEPTPDPTVCDAPLARAAASFARAAGGEPDGEGIAGDAADVPEALQNAIAPILQAMEEVIAARTAAVEYFGQLVAEDVAVNTPDLTGVGSGNAQQWITSTTRQDELLAPWRAELVAAAHHVAIALDHARPVLAAGGFGEGFAFDLETPLGSIRIRDGADDVHDVDLEPVALAVDTGGADTWLGGAGATATPVGELLPIPVAIAIDAGGDDRYGYEEFPGRYDGVGHRPPSDLWGRNAAGEGPYCVFGELGQLYGPVTLSREVRQGVGVFGVGMLVDLGGGADRYTALRRSQGFGAAGVGLLLDDGGDDRYVLESEGQGAATDGIGVLLDLGGSDEYSSYEQSQGFGYIGGAGLLVDAGGDDAYLCDHGIAAEGGDPIYCSPQLPGDGNSSLCQGAGFGLRGDPPRDPPTYLAGGVGILRDQDGDDRYEASVFAQGTGYWQGIGLLSDGGGNDLYDARWYVQGAAAHYAVGMLTDAGGDDHYNDARWIVGVAVGSGHDYSLGLLVEESGDDVYFGQGNALGDGNCNGIGLLVDNGGADHWSTTTRESLGHAHVSDECVRRGGALTGALFLDAGGTDVYERPEGDPVAADDAAFAQNADHDGEVGAFLDAAEGDTSMHVTPR